LIFLKVDAVYCPNIRSGMRFAVADAYQYWADVPEVEWLEILRNGKGQVVQ
jgi:putative phosphoribosyl transferase